VERAERAAFGTDAQGLVPVTPILRAKIKFFGRHKGGSIRDGVILSIDARAASRGDAIWSCDSDEVIAAFQAEAALAAETANREVLVHPT
jgi:hypothetical protein